MLQNKGLSKRINGKLFCPLCLPKIEFSFSSHIPKAFCESFQFFYLHTTFTNMSYKVTYVKYNVTGLQKCIVNKLSL